MIKAPDIDRLTQDKLKDEAHKMYIDKGRSVSQCWFEAVWNEIQRMGFEIKNIEKEGDANK